MGRLRRSAVVGIVLPGLYLAPMVRENTVLVSGTAPHGTARPMPTTPAPHGPCPQLQDAIYTVQAAGRVPYSMEAYANHGIAWHTLQLQLMTRPRSAPDSGTAQGGMARVVHCGVALPGEYPRQPIRIIFVQAAGIASPQTIPYAARGFVLLGAQGPLATHLTATVAES